MQVSGHVTSDIHSLSFVLVSIPYTYVVLQLLNAPLCCPATRYIRLLVGGAGKEHMWAPSLVL